MPRSQLPATPQKRNGFWYLIRKTPQEFWEIEPRRLIQIATGVRVADDPKGIRAKELVRQLDADLQALWKAKISGSDPNARERYEAAVKEAQRHGFQYVPAAKIPALGMEEFLRRIEKIAALRAEDEPSIVTALAGLAPVPVFRASELVDAYEAVLSVDLARKSERQRYRWRINRQTALDTFVEAIGGDKEVSALTRQDVLTFRNKLRDRAIAGDIEAGTVNKILGRVAAMFRAVNEDRQLGIGPLFDNVRLRGAKDGQRLAYEASYVPTVLGSLDGLNEEARRVVLLIAETGLRLSEAVNLTSNPSIWPTRLFVIKRPSRRG